MSRNSSINKMTDSGMDDWCSIPGREFSFRHQVPIGSDAHPVSYSGNTRGSSPRGKAAGSWRWALISV
jgi:hypothetical protein